MDRLYRELRPRGLEVVAVDVREPPELVRRTVRERGYSMPVLLDVTGEVSGVGYGVFGPPTVYLIDRHGRLLARGVGPRDWTSPAVRRLLDELLDGRVPSPATPAGAR